MKNTKSIDSNFLLRFLYIHCFLHIYRVLTNENTTHTFSPPRFELFKEIKRSIQSTRNSLFQNLVLTFKWNILIGGFITLVFASFNLLVPQLIKMFMHFMHEHHSESKEVSVASNFIRTLVAVQIIRLVFGEHSKRLFHEVAIKIESSLSKMLVTKSLKLTQQARKDIPQSEIIQLQNVDLKLTFQMFNNMYLIFQAPFTIIVAIIMLFVESKTYGFIGVYWFLIAFLLHRELDQKMTHCNSTKLGLIQKRSKVNYQILDCIKQAKVIGWQDVIIQKNNDLFEQENHDHYIFYFYSSLYDIILLMLPILVVVTICVYDLGEKKPITVEQVYLMLSLLGICYQPMKSFRTISINFHDGLHSLSRINQYLSMPQYDINKIIDKNIEKGHIFIQENTSFIYPGSIFDFYLQIKSNIQINRGEKLLIIGRKGHGRTSFMNMLNGFMQKISGQVKIRGPVAYLSENFFFTKAKIRQNISFYDEKVSQEQIQKLFQYFGLHEELNKIGGLNATMDDINIFTKSQLQKIALLRVICSNANIYMLDMPFQFLDQEDQNKLNKILKKKQYEKNITIVMTISYLDFVDNSDKILIIQKGQITESGTYQALIKNKNSSILNYFSSQQEKQEVKSTGKRSANKKSTALTKFQKSVKKISAINTALKGFSSFISQNNKQKQKQNTNSMLKSVFENIMQAKIKEKKELERKRKNIPFRTLVKEFIFSVPFTETIFILLIIACAQLLHVFIHFWIGHLEQDHGQNSYENFRSMIVIQVILTIGLACVLYYEGQVSSMIAIIQGHTLYKKSLQTLVSKDIEWFTNQYSVKIADKFNHDYEQVFIACHSLLGIYKNIIILIVTIRFISSDSLSIIIIFLIISGLYFSILWLFRTVERKVVKHFYDYKYSYVQLLQQSIQGSEYFHIFEKQQALIKKTEAVYKKLASYKLAERNTSYGLSIACDLMSVLLLAGAVSYGLQMKIHNTASNIALIATSIHLLMNGSQVLKNIVKDTVTFETFFLINLVPFLSVKQQKTLQQNDNFMKERTKKVFTFDISIKNAIFKQAQNKRFLHPISINIKEGEIIMIYNTDDTFRNLFLYSFTQQIKIQKNEEGEKMLEIGGVNVNEIDKENLRYKIGIVMSKNFYMSGTLRDNILRKIEASDEQIDKYVKILKLDEEIEDYDIKGPDAHVTFENNKVNNEITKKLAVVRILIRKCPIIFIKDTPSFIGSKSLVQLFRHHIQNCTIIKISNKIQAAFDVNRIISIDDHIVLEDGHPTDLMKTKNSLVGGMLKDANLEGYLFMNKVSRVNMAKGFLKKIVTNKVKK